MARAPDGRRRPGDQEGATLSDQKDPCEETPATTEGLSPPAQTSTTVGTSRSSGSRPVPVDSRLTVVLLNLAELYGTLQGARNFEAAFDRLVGQLWRQVPGLHTGAAAGMLMDQAVCARTRGEPLREQRLLSLALRLLEAVHGPGGPLVADALVALGLAHRRLGETWQEMGTFERALDVEEQFFGKSSARAALTRSRLDVAYGDFWAKERELELLEDAASLAEQQHGLCSPEVVAALVLLAQACGDVGRAPRQKELLERALRGAELLLEQSLLGRGGEGDPSPIAAVLALLARAHLALGEPKLQQERLERALGAILAAPSEGSERPEASALELELAMAHLRLGEVQLAEGLCRRAVSSRGQRLGAAHPLVSESLVHLGLACAALGDEARWVDHLDRAAWSLLHSRCVPLHRRRPAALRLARKALADVGGGADHLWFLNEERTWASASTAKVPAGPALQPAASRANGSPAAAPGESHSARSAFAWSARSLPEEGLAMRPVPNAMEPTSEEDEHPSPLGELAVASENSLTLSSSSAAEDSLLRSARSSSLEVTMRSISPLESDSPSTRRRGAVSEAPGLHANASRRACENGAGAKPTIQAL